jgi:hypothetical protein
MGTAGVKHGSDFARISGGATDNAAGMHWRTSDGNHGFVAGGKGSDVYAGRNGNVYRKDDGSWQKHTSDGWQDVNRPSTENLKDHAQNFQAKHPDAAERIRTEKPVRRADKVRERAPEHLAIDRAGRQIGNQRELRHDFGRQDIGRFRGDGRSFQAHEFSGRRAGGFHSAGGARFRRR